MKKLTIGIITAMSALTNAAQAGALEDTLARGEVKCGALGTISKCQ